MSVSSLGRSIYAGPERPWEPLGEAIQLTGGMKTQDYQDGTLLEISARVGTLAAAASIPAGGVWSTAFEDNGVLYVSVWYPKDNGVQRHAN